ncbi:FIST C-terminal domain-containing protein [Sulfurimonas sp. SAG-AH-194-I05]|nr:FIST N-terminal domain-containing protein [Sulfurimonas sp. SAG-AH-194-I05]MDF1875653.1 FIST C-terminal domain-containing protein [Sulfurimonas sp. SAG-AH-194-I05]
MQIESLYYDNSKWNFENENIDNKSEVHLVMAFGDTDIFSNKEHYAYLKSLYPHAEIVGCSSSGNVLGAQISKKSIVATAICFKNATVKVNTVDFINEDDLEHVSKNLVAGFSNENLKSIFIISDGLHMNGSILAKGVNLEKENILITGGLAGDDARFEKTFVMANDIPKEKRVVAIAFYGDNLSVSSGCYAGWEEFGIERIITKSTANVVYEIDNEPALSLYKKYLGAEAENLPATGLRFPLNIRENESDKGVARTLLAVDEEMQSLTFAGDVPEGSLARLMKTDIDGLIDGSGKAAEKIEKSNGNSALGLIVSCVGRKLVMNDLVDEELEIIEDVVGSNVHLTGFYSYGELAPFSDEVLNCKLHNQTMTLTVIYEK